MAEVGFNCLDFSLIFCGFLCMVVSLVVVA